MSCNLSWLHTVCVHLQHVLGNRVYALKGTDRFLKKREHTPQKKWSHDTPSHENVYNKNVLFNSRTRYTCEPRGCTEEFSEECHELLISVYIYFLIFCEIVNGHKEYDTFAKYKWMSSRETNKMIPLYQTQTNLLDAPSRFCSSREFLSVKQDCMRLLGERLPPPNPNPTFFFLHHSLSFIYSFYSQVSSCLIVHGPGKYLADKLYILCPKVTNP